jgi:hypothetical protein
MPLIVLPFLAACGLAAVLLLLFKLFEQHFKKRDAGKDNVIRHELEGTIWVLEDGSHARFKDIVDGGRYFLLDSADGAPIKVLASSLFRLPLENPVKEI